MQFKESPPPLQSENLFKKKEVNYQINQNSQKCNEHKELIENELGVLEGNISKTKGRTAQNQQKFQQQSIVQAKQLITDTKNRQKRGEEEATQSSLRMIGEEELPEVGKSARFLDNKYRLLYSIGEGRYAQVKLAIDGESRKKVALKIMKESCVSDQKSVDSFLREVSILSQVAPCPNVVQLKRVCMSNEIPSSRNTLYYVMKVAENGELFKFLLHTPKFQEPLAKHFFSQLLQGLGHLHDRGISHRDIKPENILIDKKLRLKLCDFGFSVKSRSDSGNPILFDSSDPVGSPEYNAPEITQNSYACKKYNPEQADIFSAGCVLFMMVLGSAPFESTSASDRYYSRFCMSNKASFWKIFSYSCKPSSSFKDLMHGMLEPDPSKRLTIEEIRKHQWMTSEPDISEEEVRREMGDRIKKVFEKTLEELKQSLKKKEESSSENALKTKLQSEGFKQKYLKQIKEINQQVVRKLQHIKQQRILFKQAQPASKNPQGCVSSQISNPSLMTSKQQINCVSAPSSTIIPQINQESKQQEGETEKLQQIKSELSQSNLSKDQISDKTTSFSLIEKTKIPNSSSKVFDILSNTKQLIQPPSSKLRKISSTGYQSDDCIKSEHNHSPPRRQHDSAPASLSHHDSS